MNRFHLELEASVDVVGGANPTLEVLVNGAIVSSLIITAQTGVGTNLLFGTFEYPQPLIPTSLSFRYSEIDFEVQVQ